MLTHPDPHIQLLFNDITEQRDIAMVKAANLSVALTQAQQENAGLKLEIERLAPAEAVTVSIDVPEPAPE